MSNFGLRCGSKSKTPPCNEAFILPGSGLVPTLAQVLNEGNSTADIFFPAGNDFILSSGNQIFLTAGTINDPAITFTGDSDAGIYRAAGLMGFTAPDAAGFIFGAGTGGFEVNTTGQLDLDSSQAAANAVRIAASNAAGGINIIAGTQGISTTNITGPINFTTSDATLNAIRLNATAGGINVDAALDIDFLTAGQLDLESSEAAANAVRIAASDVAGGINIIAGTAGIATTGVTGPIEWQTSDATLNAIILEAVSGGINIDAGLDVDVLTAGQLDLESTQAAANAVRIAATDVAGGVNFLAGTAGIATTNITGPINWRSTGDQVQLRSDQAAVNAIRLNASDVAGGIDIDAGTGGIQLDATGQVNIASTQAANNAVRLFADNLAGGVNIEASDAVGITFTNTTTGNAASIVADGVNNFFRLLDGTIFSVDQAGGNAIAGTATLVAGTVTVATTSAMTMPNSTILISRNTPGGTLGNLSVPSAAIVDGVSFDIDSDSAMETSTVNWFVINA